MEVRTTQPAVQALYGESSGAHRGLPGDPTLSGLHPSLKNFPSIVVRPGGAVEKRRRCSPSWQSRPKCALPKNPVHLNLILHCDEIPFCFVLHSLCLEPFVHAADADAGLIADGAKVEVLAEATSSRKAPPLIATAMCSSPIQPNDRIVKYNAATVRSPTGSSRLAQATAPSSTRTKPLACADEKNELLSPSRRDKKVRCCSAISAAKLLNEPE